MVADMMEVDRIDEGEQEEAKIKKKDKKEKKEKKDKKDKKETKAKKEKKDKKKERKEKKSSKDEVTTTNGADTNGAEEDAPVSSNAVEDDITNGAAAAASPVEEDVTEAAAAALPPPTDVDASPNDSKKRKRSNPTLEIDVSAPEPPSKKQARKLKKLKEKGVDVDALTAANVDLTGSTAKEDGDKRSPYGVWIGNLPFDTTSEQIRDFLLTGKMKDGEEGSTGILVKDITRIKLPKESARSNASRNKGFAYVDFTKPECISYAVLLSESWVGNRKVLIKASTDFKGRPDHIRKRALEAENDPDAAAAAALKANGPKNPPSKTVFVGNLGFETTDEELKTHFSKTGVIKKIRMATFEDTGKSKGYAWVDFDTQEAAESVHATRTMGFLGGRKLRLEYGEGATVRYNKRFGKKPPTDSEENNKQEKKPKVRKPREFTKPTQRQEKKPSETDDFIPLDLGDDFVSTESARARRTERRTAEQKDKREKKAVRKFDARKVKPGMALARAERAKIGIVEGQGTKINF